MNGSEARKGMKVRYNGKSEPGLAHRGAKVGDVFTVKGIENTPYHGTALLLEEHPANLYGADR